MEKKKQYSVKALSALMGLTISELAEKCGINKYHLQQVSCGRIKMSSEDIIKLSKYTGVSAKEIKM